MPLPAELQDAYAKYMADPNHEGGIPTDLYRYAQDNPGAGIDRSGWGLAKTDPMFNFYNPNPGQQQGANWFPNDDRNNPMLQPGFDPNSTGYNPRTADQIAQLSGNVSATPWSPGGSSEAPRFDFTPGVTNITTPTLTTYDNVPQPGRQTFTPQNVQTLSGGTPAAPTAPTTPATPAPPQYDFSNILNQYGINSQQLTGNLLPVLQDIISKMNQGYNPETLSALRSQATAGIPGQYESAARQLRMSLLRQGAIGAGELPGSAGDILRSFAPLDQARAEAVAGANRGTILANQAEVARNQQRGSEAIGQTLQAQGLTNQLLSAGIDYMKATKLADFDAMTRIKLAQMGIDSNEKLAALQSQTQLALGNLDATTRLTISNLDNDTQRWMGTLNSDTQKQLAQLQSTTQTNLGLLDADTRIKIANIESAPGSLKSILLASIVSSTLGGGVDKNGKPTGGVLSTLASKGLDAIIKIFGGGKKDTTGTGNGFVGGDSIGGLATDVASGVKDALVGLGGAVASGASSVVSATAALLMNPITAVIGGAIAATTIWLKSQAHWEANSWVHGYQDKFDTQMNEVNQQFWQLAQSGQLTKAAGQQIMSAARGMIDTYEAQRQKFEGQGSDEKTVAGQSLATFRYWYGENGSKFLGSMEQALAGLNA